MKAPEADYDNARSFYNILKSVKSDCVVIFQNEEDGFCFIEKCKGVFKGNPLLYTNASGA